MAGYVERASVLERLEHLWQSGELSDATFLVGPEQEKVKAHRLLFAISSPVFFRMFFGGLPERSGPIRVPDITPAGFTGMARYMYTDALPLHSVEQACSVLDAARKYMMPFLESKCLKYVEEHVCASRAIELYEYARALEYYGLMARCLELIMCDTAEAVCGGDFADADRATVLKVTQLPLLLISEAALFRKVEEWARRYAQTTGRELSELAGELSDIVGSIRFLAMTEKEFASGPARSHLLSEKEKCAIYASISDPWRGGYPERLCADTTGRDRETTRWFSCRIEVSELKQLNGTEKLYSRVRHVSDVAWKFMVNRWFAGDYDFCLCAEDAQETVKVPGVCKGRLLDQNGVELEMSSGNGWIKGWRDATNYGHTDGCLQLCFGFIKASVLDDYTSVMVEAVIRK